jgi:intein/homing endonuclease
MYIFLLRNNVVSNIRRCERKRYEKKTKPQWWIEITGRDERHLGKSNIVGDYRYSAIKAYEFFDIEEDVYNIEVEDDESYVVNHTIVHNCVMSLWIAKECASSDSFNFGFIGAE